MSCLDPQVPVIPKITRGSAISIPVALPVDQFTGQPVDVSSASEIKFALPNADGTTVLQLLKTTSGIADNGYKQGDFLAVISEAQSLLLKLSDADTEGDIDARVEYIIAGKTYIVNLPGYCTVVENIFPGL